jgi:hypothetical protein
VSSKYMVNFSSRVSPKDRVGMPVGSGVTAVFRLTSDPERMRAVRNSGNDPLKNNRNLT